MSERLSGNCWTAWQPNSTRTAQVTSGRPLLGGEELAAKLPVYARKRSRVPSSDGYYHLLFSLASTRRYRRVKEKGQSWAPSLQEPPG